MRSEIAGQARGCGFFEKHPDVRSVSGARPFYSDGQPNLATSFQDSLRILAPILLVQIDGQEPATLVEEHWVNSGDEGMPLEVLAQEMPPDDIIGDRQKPLMRTIPALDLGFLADAADPFVAAGRLVARSTSLAAFEPAGINIIATTEKRPEQLYLHLSRSVLSDGESWRGW